MQNTFQMINVGGKPTTHRVAVACGEIVVGREAFELIRDKKLPKGDVLTLAEVAGIMGAKQASQVIPLCHPMGLDHVKVQFELDETTASVHVFCTAATHAKTGVEMEAIAGVNAALLTVWDLSKMINADLEMRSIKLLGKKGGKSGVWLNPAGVPDWVQDLIAPPLAQNLNGLNIAIVTLSDRAAAGVYDDLSGALMADILSAAGANIAHKVVLPDDGDELRLKLIELAAQPNIHAIITTGGTGVSSRDITPEIVNGLAERTIPGIGELLRQFGAQFTPFSWASRSTAAIVNKTLIITLPGSPKAVKEGLDCLIPLIPHFVKTINDGKTE